MKLKMTKTKTEIKQIVEKASEAFWDVVLKANPTIKTGDFGIEETQEWNNNCEKAVSHWIEMNTREENK